MYLVFKIFAQQPNKNTQWFLSWFVWNFKLLQSTHQGDLPLSNEDLIHYNQTDYTAQPTGVTNYLSQANCLLQQTSKTL